VLTPRQFVDDLKVLDLSGVGSRAIPNGLRDLRAARPYQVFYDERYFTRDAPQPAPRQQPTQKAPPLGKSMSARSVGRSGPESPFTGSSLSVNSSYASSPTNGRDKAGKEKKRFWGF
jgi:syntaxin-binding protein 1